ncbi:MAG: DUF2452 domain-containing protein [Leptonema sp. (in: bacteria)]
MEPLEVMENLEEKNEAFLPYPTKTSDPPFSLVDKAKEIEKSDLWIQTSVNQKLNFILEQIRSLQEKAKQIIEKAEEDARLHRVQCNFEKKPGMIIHLYQKQENVLYFSLLSPEEWGTPPHKYLGSYQLQADMSFEKIRE